VEKAQKIVIVGGILVSGYLVYRYLQSKEEYNNFVTMRKRLFNAQKSIEIEKLKIKEKNNFAQSNEPEPQSTISIKHGDQGENVRKWKKIINHFYEGILLDQESDVYDDDTLRITQEILVNTPALFNYKTGEVCLNFITNIDYLLERSYDVNTEYNLEELEGLDQCEKIGLGTKGYKVVELQRLINIIRGDELLKETGSYSRNMRNVVQETFGESNVITKDTQSSVCYRFIKSFIIMYKNIKELQTGEEYEEQPVIEEAEQI
jgi:hypothetical protein